MIAIPRLILLSLAALLLAACATQPPVTSVWTAPAQAGHPYQRPIVLGVATSPKVRRAYEDHFVKQLTAYGTNAQAGHDLIPDRYLGRLARLKSAIAHAKADAVFIAHLVADEDSHHQPMTRLAAVPAHYYTLADYVSQVYRDISAPDYYSNPKGLRLEVNIYDAKQARLVWSGRSQLLDPSSERTTIGQVIGEIIAQMGQDGVLPRPPVSTPASARQVDE
ncbi:hypothetical protein GWK36_02125 [Caldichromatium japonicum]|uniref:DUF4136 domain-containing protein n=1 Tax=Caldichromatium japonicum TaxID=2699430 RepID=A0A6G7VAL4_9GAMM|nr:hypothetical protein [Caldichromatium japonicum]QIK36992.1 hypothetical protein GWK36_02125 [Caldichromatium japonicum]